MNTTTGDWSLAREDDLIVGADGNTWRVESKTGPKVSLVRVKDSKKHVGTPSGTVEFLSAGWLEEQAVARIEEHMHGSTVVSRQRGDGTHVCPADYVHVGTLQAHLMLFHKTTPPRDEQDMATLNRVHANLHNTTDTYEPHVHDPDWQETP